MSSMRRRIGRRGARPEQWRIAMFMVETNSARELSEVMAAVREVHARHCKLCRSADSAHIHVETAGW